MKILIIWNGSIVPAYQPFFFELAKYFSVRVLSPKIWIHGSKTFKAKEKKIVGNNLEIIATTFLPNNSARYFIPKLLINILIFKPNFLYIMDELDRLSTSLHGLLAKALHPRLKIVCYSLQNIERPAYYRWNHRLAIKINIKIMDKVIAASEEAAMVVKSHGFNNSLKVIGLPCSQNFFFPSSKSERDLNRKKLSIQSHEIAIIYVGSIAEAKGIKLLMNVLPFFPTIKIISVGNGPLVKEIRALKNNQWIQLDNQEGDELRITFSACDYVILPSITLLNWKEQIGRSLIEGILCGCIAIGSDSGNIPKLTLFPETTFNQGSKESLIDLFNRIPFHNEAEIKILQKRNVDEKYSADCVAKMTSSFLVSDK